MRGADRYGAGRAAARHENLAGAGGQQLADLNEDLTQRGLGCQHGGAVRAYHPASDGQNMRRLFDRFHGENALLLTAR